MWHSIGKGPIWSFPETEILKKIDEMFKKLKKIIFLILVFQRPPETPLCLQNIEKVEKFLENTKIFHRNDKESMWKFVRFLGKFRKVLKILRRTFEKILKKYSCNGRF